MAEIREDNEPFDDINITPMLDLAYVLLVAYLVYSCGVWALLRRSTQPPRIPWILWVDLVFPTVFMLFTEGPNSPFFMFFVFVLTTAAFRGGFFETLLTSAAAGALVTLEALVIVLGPQSWHVAMGESFEVNR